MPRSARSTAASIGELAGTADWSADRSVELAVLSSNLGERCGALRVELQQQELARQQAEVRRNEAEARLAESRVQRSRIASLAQQEAAQYDEAAAQVDALAGELMESAAVASEFKRQLKQEARSLEVLRLECRAECQQARWAAKLQEAAERREVEASEPCSPSQARGAEESEPRSTNQAPNNSEARGRMPSHSAHDANFILARKVFIVGSLADDCYIGAQPSGFT